MLGRRLGDFSLRRVGAPTVDTVVGLRHHWRHWVGLGVHLASIYSGEMVSRSAWHGHRHGHYGFWRRGHDWLTVGRHTDEPLF